jgi:ATP-dependent Clp protease, protease subunit
MKKKIGKFYDIMTTEGSTEATIFLYGFIGEEYSVGADGWEMTGNTDMSFIREIESLSEQYSVINVRINSWGGEIYHGLAMISAMQRCKAEVHTYIDGLAASMAGVIWLAGKKRHMAKNAMLMLHAGINVCYGNGKEMRETADILDQFTKTMILAIAESTGQTAEEINSKYFADYEDHWLTHDEVSAETGWLFSPEDYAAAAAIPDDITNMTYHQIVAHFKEKDDPKGQSIMQQVKAAFAELKAVFTPPPAAIQSPNNIQEMTIEDFKNSLTDGTLSPDDVKAHLASLETPATVAIVAPDDSAEKLSALEAKYAALEAKFVAFAAAPGAGKSAPQMPDEDHPVADGQLTEKQRYEAANKKLAAAADAGEPAKFVIQ